MGSWSGSKKRGGGSALDDDGTAWRSAVHQKKRGRGPIPSTQPGASAGSDSGGTVRARENADVCVAPSLNATGTAAQASATPEGCGRGTRLPVAGRLVLEPDTAVKTEAE